MNAKSDHPVQTQSTLPPGGASDSKMKVKLRGSTAYQHLLRNLSSLWERSGANLGKGGQVSTLSGRSADLLTWLHRFDRDELGGAYTLSYVMVIPFLMLMVALTVESALMMSAKIGTVYSAHAAVRSASVYGTQHSWGETVDWAEQSAMQAMVPFASGSTRTGGTVSAGPNGETLVAAYEDWADDGASNGYLRAKVADVAARLTVELDSKPAQWDSELRAVVTYDFPFHVPGIGQLLGKRGSDGVYVFPLRTIAIVGNDGPQNPDQNLGIGYGTEL